MSETLTQKAEKFFKAIPPIPQNIKDEFLIKVRDKVVHYKPKMEEACGVEMGNIDVADLTWYHIDSDNKKMTEAIDEANLLDKAILLAIIKPLIKPIRILHFNLVYHDIAMVYNSSTIYVPFYFVSRLEDFKAREETLDQEVVHELSHRLWEVLSGELLPRKPSDDVLKFWAEGFASYCDGKYFSDFYPEGYEAFEPDGIFKRGMERIEELVEKHGEDIVIEIPKRWRELDGN